MSRLCTLALAALLTCVAAQASFAGLSGVSEPLLSPEADLDPSIPDLRYNYNTGEVVIDWEGNTLISYVLKNTTNSFIAGNHNTILLGSFPTATSTELSESTSFAEPGVTTRSMGNVFPAGLDLTGLQSLLSVNSIVRGLATPQVPFDLVIVDGPIDPPPVVPEPSTYAMAFMGLGAIGFYGWRRRKLKA